MEQECTLRARLTVEQLTPRQASAFGSRKALEQEVDRAAVSQRKGSHQMHFAKSVKGGTGGTALSGRIESLIQGSGAQPRLLDFSR